MANNPTSRREDDLLIMFQEIVEAAIPGSTPTRQEKAKALSVGSIMFLVGIRFQRDFAQFAIEWQNALERFFASDDMTPETLEVIIRETSRSMSRA
jgi:hypothetical protein